jgi:hypothetical protein
MEKLKKFDVYRVKEEVKTDKCTWNLAVENLQNPTTFLRELFCQRNHNHKFGLHKLLIILNDSFFKVLCQQKVDVFVNIGFMWLWNHYKKRRESKEEQEKSI